MISEKTPEQSMDKVEAELMLLLRKTLAPEFLNRIDDIIVFSPLSPEAVVEIVKLQFALLNKRLSEKNISLELTERAAKHLAEEGFDPTFGARPIKRLINHTVAKAVSTEILRGSLLPGATAKIDIVEGEIVIVKAGSKKTR